MYIGFMPGNPRLIKNRILVMKSSCPEQSILGLKLWKGLRLGSAHRPERRLSMALRLLPWVLPMILQVAPAKRSLRWSRPLNGYCYLGT